jgi:hypothetical protein
VQPVQVKLSSSSEIFKAPISLPRRKHSFLLLSTGRYTQSQLHQTQKQKQKKKTFQGITLSELLESLKRSPRSTLTLPSSSSGIAGAGVQEASFPNPQQQLLDTQTQCTSVGQLLPTSY